MHITYNLQLKQQENGKKYKFSSGKIQIFFGQVTHMLCWYEVSVFQQ